MTIQAIAAVSQEEERYRRRTPASQRFFQQARQYLPGGDSRSTLFYRPYPAVMDRGEGCWLFDLDGNRLLDFTGNHSSLIHGYGHPAIIEAVEEQLRKGTCFPGASEAQLRFAELLCQRIPSVERIRFASSGTEAVMNAIRAARAFTGRSRIAKVEGGYHGTADDVMVSIHPTAQDAGLRNRPHAVAGSSGLAPAALGETVVLPFNDPEGALQLIQSERDNLAAVLVEPVLGSAGMIASKPEYLAALREATSRFGILLIFDEVVSFRIAFGGAEEYFGVRPDLTCLGKLIGGGFPLGAFGGREDVMTLFDPSRGRPAIPHPGSYNANPMGMVAGTITLELLTRSVIERLSALGDAVRQDLESAFEDAGVPAQITGLGSLFAVHLTSEGVTSYRDTLAADSDLRHQIFLGLYNDGILIDPRGVGTLSTALGQPEIEAFGRGIRSVLSRLRS
jgi:glutamate-1-semialdehyde 2,1-aminomutase